MNVKFAQWARTRALGKAPGKAMVSCLATESFCRKTFFLPKELLSAERASFCRKTFFRFFRYFGRNLSVRGPLFRLSAERRNFSFGGPLSLRLNSLKSARNTVSVSMLMGDCDCPPQVAKSAIQLVPTKLNSEGEK